MKGFVPLHVHTIYSALDGAASPEEYMKRAKEIGVTHLSQTDHGTGSGHRHFQRAAKGAGITPILGVEAYFTEDMHDRRSAKKRQDGTQVYNHMTIIAKNDEGLRNLNALNKAAWNEGFYYKPRIGQDMLFERREGLIILSGCASGILSSALLNGDDERAYRLANEYLDVFGDDFYIEVMGANDVIDDLRGLNGKLLKLADKLKIKPVMTSDCHYDTKENLPLEEALLILSTNPKPNFDADLSKAQKMDWLDRFNYLYPNRSMSFQEFEPYLRSLDEEQAVFQKHGIHRTDIYDNTWEIAHKCEEYTYYKGLDMLPRPEGVDPSVELRKRCIAGLKKKNKTSQVYRDRLDEELRVIRDKGFDPYFLILDDMTNWADGQGIRRGFGRGSGAGSLVNYSLGLTGLDPIEYNLLFFRFLDPSRNDFPDIDLDFDKNRREEVKDFFRRTFHSVAGISTIGYFQGKSSIRDAARVLRIPLADVNRALKDNDASLAMNESYEYYDWFINTPKGKDFNRKYPEVVELARMLHGKLKSFGQHASAIVASKEPIENYAPVESASKTDGSGRADIIALAMGEVEEAGFIKFDILGLKTLSIVGDTLNYIRERHGVEIDVNNLPLDDAAVYEDISKGHTKGVFQCEQPAYTGLILEMGGVKNFGELTASNALVRPGAKKTIGPDYIRRKNGIDPVSYVHKDIKYFTEDTYGLPTLYQEQQMLACVELGGMSMEEANLVRRGLGKKQIEKILPFKEKFIENATEKIGAKNAEKLWADLEFGAEYNFNLSHSAAYSMLSYVTAWLKHHYPVEFMAATIRNEEDKDSITDYLIEAKRLGIKVKLPHVNTSDLKAEPEGEGAIRLGLTNIKYCGEKVARAVLLHRPFANYKELEEKVAERGSGMNKRMLETMNLVGAATFPDNPKTGSEREHYFDVLKIPAFATTPLDPRVEYQIVDLADYDGVGPSVVRVHLRGLVRKDGWCRAEVVDESGSAGFFTDTTTKAETGKMYLMLVSGNAIMRAVSLENVNAESKNSYLRYLYGRVPEIGEGQYYTVAFKARKTKAKKDMANIIAADSTGRLFDILVWPSDFESASKACANGMLWKYPVKEKEDEDGKVSYFLSLENGSRRFVRSGGSAD